MFDGDSGSTVSVSTTIHNGQTVPLNFRRLFGPKHVTGQIRVLGNLSIVHPQKFENMKKAVKELYEASGAVAETVGSEKKLLSFHKGAQAHTCFRDIVYDPITARIVRK